MQHVWAQQNICEVLLQNLCIHLENSVKKSGMGRNYNNFVCVCVCVCVCDLALVQNTLQHVPLKSFNNFQAIF
jgi:hypothetical protein